MVFKMGIMKQYILLGLTLIRVASCTSYKGAKFTETVLSSKRITITGIAGEYHKGSYRHVYVVEDSMPYYLKGDRFWDEDVLGKEVIVKGKMKRISTKPPDDGAWQYIAEMNLFVRYRCKVVR